MTGCISSQPVLNQSTLLRSVFPNAATEVRPFGIWVAGRWLHSKFVLEAVSEALSLNRVGRPTGVDAWATLGLGVVDLSELHPDLACNERVFRVTVSAVHSSSDDEV